MAISKYLVTKPHDPESTCTRKPGQVPDLRGGRIAEDARANDLAHGAPPFPNLASIKGSIEGFRLR